jgi:hypothetical protein
MCTVPSCTVHVTSVPVLGKLFISHNPDGGKVHLKIISYKKKQWRPPSKKKKRGKNLKTDLKLRTGPPTGTSRGGKP